MNSMYHGHQGYKEYNGEAEMKITIESPWRVKYESVSYAYRQLEKAFKEQQVVIVELSHALDSAKQALKRELENVGRK